MVQWWFDSTPGNTFLNYIIMNPKCYKRLILTASVTGCNKQEAQDYANDYFREHCKTTDNTFGIETEQLSEDCFLVSFYDVYFIDSLRFCDYFRHLYRKFMAAINPDFGVKIRFIVIKTDGTKPEYTPMTGALHSPY